jgi:hypothetical protein
MRNTILVALCLVLSSFVQCEESVVSFTYSNDYFGFAKQDDGRTSEMGIRVRADDVVFDIEHSMLTDRTNGTRVDEATGKVGWCVMPDLILGAGIRIRGDEAGQEAQNFVHGLIGQSEENLPYDRHETVILGWWELDTGISVLRMKSAGDVAYDTLNAELLGGLGYDWKHVGFSVLGGYEMYKTSSDSRTLQSVADGEDGWTTEVNVRAYFINFQLRTNLDSGVSTGSFIFSYRL